MYRHGKAVANARHRTNGVGAWAQMRHRAQMFHAHLLWWDRIGARIVDPADNAQFLRLHLDFLLAALGLDELRYTITVDGTLAFVGRRAAGRTLSSLETRRLTLPGVIDFETIGWSPSSGPRQVRYTVRGSLWYQTPSEIAQLLFDTGMRRPKVRFGKDGQLTLRAAD